VENIALATQASVLLEHGPSAVAEAFLASRIRNGAPAAFGTLPAGLDFQSIVDRALAESRAPARGTADTAGARPSA
jgi:putative acyl-CoA dehydrogenase